MAENQILLQEFYVDESPQDFVIIKAEAKCY